MKKTNRVPKSLLVKMLDILGLKLTRGDFMGRRMWIVGAPGHKPTYHNSLHDIFKSYRFPKEKGMEEQIKEVRSKINRAIF